MIPIPQDIIVAGVDEAGRGPLAGPVVAAAVILNRDRRIEGLDDSKRLTAKKRKAFFNLIMERAISVGVGIVDNGEIDDINILNATLKAMRIAVNKLSIIPDIIYVDGNQAIPDVDIKQKAIIKGDTLETPIMAASIIAKVTRDEIMIAYAEKYRNYGFERHKGYGTPQHLKALRDYGPTPIHRRSFSPVENILATKGNG